MLTSLSTTVLRVLSVSLIEVLFKSLGKMSYPSWCIAVLVVILAGCSGFSSNRGRMKQGIVLRDSISEDLVAGSLKEGKLDLKETFSALVRNKEFKEEVWQKKPYVCTSKLANIAGSFTMDDVQVNVDKDFVEAGRGTLEGGKGGWNMASVSTPRGNSFEEAKLRFQDVEMAMTKKSGTVVFNSAGGFIPPLAGVCLQTIEAFDLPAAINMYLTAPKQQVSAPPHTDKQEVFVLQTQGCKHWRIFSPPSPSKTPKADPYARGKGNDVLLLEELGEPLLDLVLSPGQMLYIPSGFPHTTDTLEGPCQDSTEASVHLTVGVDTHIWGLSYQALRSYALRRKVRSHFQSVEIWLYLYIISHNTTSIANNHYTDIYPLLNIHIYKLQGQWAKIRTEKLSPETYFSLQQALPLGFLSGVVVEQAGVAGFGAGMRAGKSKSRIEGYISLYWWCLV